MSYGSIVLCDKHPGADPAVLVCDSCRQELESKIDALHKSIEQAIQELGAPVGYSISPEIGDQYHRKIHIATKILLEALELVREGK